MRNLKKFGVAGALEQDREAIGGEAGWGQSVGNRALKVMLKNLDLIVRGMECHSVINPQPHSAWKVMGTWQYLARVGYSLGQKHQKRERREQNKELRVAVSS